jgi:hypothetical protein
MSLDLYVAAAGDRVIFTAGRDGKAQLAALAAGKKRIEGKAPSGAHGGQGDDGGQSRRQLLDALEASKGKDSFGYVDFQPLLALADALSDDPRAAVVSANARAPLPAYGTFAGDAAKRQLSYQLTLPPAAFSAVGAIIQASSSGGGGGEGSPDKH